MRLIIFHYVPGVQVSPEQKKSAVLNPASATKPSNTSIADIIESVVSAAREDDTSKDSASSISKSGMNCVGGSSPCRVQDLKPPVGNR